MQGEPLHLRGGSSDLLYTFLRGTLDRQQTRPQESLASCHLSPDDGRTLGGYPIDPREAVGLPGSSVRIALS